MFFLIPLKMDFYSLYTYYGFWEVSLKIYFRPIVAQ